MSILGCVGARESLDLETAARIIGEITGFDFAPDKEGDYEEFPAYLSESQNVKLALLGPPSEDFSTDRNPVGEFQLMISISGVDYEKREREFSFELAKKISGDGRLRCWW